MTEEDSMKMELLLEQKKKEWLKHVTTDDLRWIYVRELELRVANNAISGFRFVEPLNCEIEAR